MSCWGGFIRLGKENAISLRPCNPTAIPEDTAQVARAAFPRGSSLLSLRDELGPIFDDRRFTVLFLRLGQPADARGKGV